MTVYYNEIDPHAAQWLRELIARGLIAAGDVDERSIADVRPDDLRGYTQCHFFAGIGGWSLALRLAGWPDDRPVWTGSCPCQPFSAAGKQRGSDDERHLWPAFFDLIRERRPASVFGEQVAGAAGLAWLDHVCADLEGAGYAAAAADLCAAGAGAFHIRQRLYWVAHAERRAAERRGYNVDDAARSTEGQARQRQRVWNEPRASGNAGSVADTDGRNACAAWLQRSGQYGQQPQDGGACLVADLPEQGRSEQPQRHAGEDGRPAAESGRLRDAGVPAMGDATGPGPQGREQPGQRADAQRAPVERTGAAGAWADLEWIACSDGKARPTQPGLFPLVDGLPAVLVRGGDRRLAPDATAEARVMRLRGYGNAIVPQVAAAFVRAAL